MKAFSNLSFRRKLIGIILASSAAALVLGVVGFVTVELLQFRRAMSRELGILARIIADNGRAPLGFNDAKFARDTLLASLAAHPRITQAALYDADGKVFADYARAGHPRSPLPAVRPAGQEFTRSHLALFLPVMNEAEQVGTVYLQSDLLDLYTRLRTYGEVAVGVLAVALAFALLIGLWLQRFVARPVESLARTAQAVVSRNDYTLRADKYAHDELGTLTDTFNGMLAHIQDQDQALKESRERFEIAIAGAKDGIWDWDLKSNAVFLSPQWKKMLGYEDHELASAYESWESNIHPDDRALALAALNRCRDGKLATYEAEFRMRHKDGGYRWIHSRGGALCGADGKPSHRFAGSHTDITERKEAEIQLRVSREKFESLVNSLHGVVWEADGATRGTVFVSPQAEDLLGYPLERWLSETDFWEKIIHPDDRSRTVEACQRAVAAGNPFQLEYRARTADGRVVWLRDSISVTMDAGKPRLMRGVTLDITEHKLAEQELEKARHQLMEASRLAGMEEVATAVLHNVGNVLNSVNVSATLVSDRVRQSKVAGLHKAAALLQQHRGQLTAFLTADPKGKALPDYFIKLSEHLSVEQSELLRELQSLTHNIEHIKEIVAMQQSYAKVGGCLEPLPPAPLVEDALRINAEALARHRVEVVREFAEVPAVLADRHKVLQVLVNLISNAKHALEDDRPRDKRLTLGIARNGNGRVKIAVRDNGVGIAPENLAKIFQHGFTTKKDGHGFGLHSGALAATEMGGTLAAHSDGPGEGATFTLELPMAPERTN